MNEEALKWLESMAHEVAAIDPKTEAEFGVTVIINMNREARVAFTANNRFSIYGCGSTPVAAMNDYRVSHSRSLERICREAKERGYRLTPIDPPVNPNEQFTEFSPVEPETDEIPAVVLGGEG